MFYFKENTGLTDSGVDKEIDHRKLPYFSGILHESFGQDRIVIVGEIFSEVIEGKTGLQVQCFFEKIIGVIQRVSGYDLRHI